MIAVPAMMGIAIFAFAMQWAVYSDVRSLTVPNSISILLVAAYFLLAPFAGFSLREMGFSLAAAAATGVVLVAVYSRGWFGAGDTKLMTAIALWLGAGQVPSFLLCTSLFAGVLAAGTLVLRAIRPKPSSAVAVRTMPLLPGRAPGIPLAVAIASAGLIGLTSSSWMLAVQ